MNVNFSGIWNSGTAYNQGDFVVYQNVMYIALENVPSGQLPPDINLSWELVVYGAQLGPVTPTPTVTSSLTPTPTNTETPTSTPTPTPTPSSGASGNFNVTITQVGPDVVWSGSGSFNLTALTSSGTGSVSSGFNAGQAIWAIGVSGLTDTYSGVTTYPTTFGIGGVGVTSSLGSIFGILPGGSGRLLYVPSGYVSNTTISGSATYASQTIAGMGLTSGTYTWSWGSGGNTSTLVMIIG